MAPPRAKAMIKIQFSSGVRDVVFPAGTYLMRMRFAVCSMSAAGECDRFQFSPPRQTVRPIRHLALPKLSTVQPLPLFAGRQDARTFEASPPFRYLLEYNSLGVVGLFSEIPCYGRAVTVITGLR